MRAAIVIAEDATTESIIHFKPCQLSRSGAGVSLGFVRKVECLIMMLPITLGHSYAFDNEATRLGI